MNEQISRKISITHTVHILHKNTRLKGKVVLGYVMKAYMGSRVTPPLLNPLKAELNPICHLLILLGDLTFMSTFIVSIFQYISNKMQRYAIYLYLETTLHVSDGTFTHHQVRIQLYLQHLVIVTPLLLSAAIVEELEPV
jgi:hypothetical protein